jgi:uncharacterized damage-inducible protein DinB
MSIFTNSMKSAPAEAAQYTSAVLGLLGAQKPFDVLKKTPSKVKRAVARLTPRQVSKPEAPEKWSVKQVVQHLADSELVWGWRLRLVLSHDRPTITGYDQDAWADRLGYASVQVDRALEEFTVLRNANLRLLQRATPADLKRVGVHSERGEESVEHWLKLYAGHDILHLNQIERIKKAVL